MPLPAPPVSTNPAPPPNPAAATPPPPAAQPGVTPPPAPPADPGAPKLSWMEQDPNHQLRQMIRNRKPKGNEEPKPAEKPPETTPKAGNEPEPKPASGVTGLIAKALKFRTEDPAAPKEPEKKPEEPVVEPAKTPEKPAKSIVSKKKPAGTTVDPMKVASEAAAAAVREAVGAMSKPSVGHSEDFNPETDLPDEYRREYEIAQHLAATNPKYKDAATDVLDEYRRVEDYASKWEAANPGKVFDPGSEDHDEFYGTLKKPWSDHEFRQAEVRLEAKKIAAEESAEMRQELDRLKETTARQELGQSVGKAIETAAVVLAKSVDETAHGAIVKDGYGKFAEADPITAETLEATLNQVAPLIETAIQIDDPQRRIKFDPKNVPLHKEWLNFLFEKEEQFAGQQDEQGRTFASRNAYVKLTPAQQARRWFLDVNHIVSEIVNDAALAAKGHIEKERVRLKKIAESMGYTPKPEKNGGSAPKPQKTDATHRPEVETTPKPNTDNGKPASPTAGQGVKIDDLAGANMGKDGDLLAATRNVLFGR